MTVPRALRPRPGLVFHRAEIPPDECTEVDGIPVTTAARTLLDLAACLPPFRVEKAIREAEYRRLADSPSLPQLMARYPGRRGPATLRPILRDAPMGDAITRSELEIASWRSSGSVASRCRT